MLRYAIARTAQACDVSVYTLDFPFTGRLRLTGKITSETGKERSPMS
ncbi:MAG: hypothetical protein ICV63_14125 [Coleofasciculus sp. Co-bin14]|nr:hypothetical protein [Coleofasciculus sp. Co-bin14]